MGVLLGCVCVCMCVCVCVCVMRSGFLMCCLSGIAEGWSCLFDLFIVRKIRYLAGVFLLYSLNNSNAWGSCLVIVLLGKHQLDKILTFFMFVDKLPLTCPLSTSQSTFIIFL